MKNEMKIKKYINIFLKVLLFDFKTHNFETTPTPNNAFLSFKIFKFKLKKG